MHESRLDAGRTSHPSKSDLECLEAPDPTALALQTGEPGDVTRFDTN